MQENFTLFAVPLHRSFVVQKGFKCDGPSLPSVFSFFPSNFDRCGWLLHDWLYTTHGVAEHSGDLVTKEEADSVLSPLYGMWMWHRKADLAWQESFLDYERLKNTEFGRWYFKKHSRLQHLTASAFSNPGSMAKCYTTYFINK